MSRSRRAIDSPCTLEAYLAAHQGLPFASEEHPVNRSARATRSTPPGRGAASTASVPGLIVSPHSLSRGKRARSTRSTRAPARDRTVAATLPAGPAPEMMTSNIPGPWSFVPGPRSCPRVLGPGSRPYNKRRLSRRYESETPRGSGTWSSVAGPGVGRGRRLCGARSPRFCSNISWVMAPPRRQDRWERPSPSTWRSFRSLPFIIRCWRARLSSDSSQR